MGRSPIPAGRFQKTIIALIGLFCFVTDIVPPGNFVSLGVSLDVTLKVDVVSLLQVSGVDSWPEIEFNMRRN